MFSLLSLALGLLPASWLIGHPGPSDPRQLFLGLWIHRAAWIGCGVFLLLVRGGESRGPEEVRRWRFGDLFILGGVAAALRLPGLGRQLWFDEMWMVVDYVRHPMVELLRSYPSDNNHPLYSLLATGCARLFSESPAALRLPAYLFGILGVCMLHIFGAGLVGRRRSLLAALLLALSFHHVAFSQNARGYTGLVFFALLSSHAFLKVLKGGGAASWRLHGLALALGMWLHLTMLFVALAQGLILLFLLLRGRPLWGGLKGFGLGALLSIGLHGLILPQMVDQLLLKKTVVKAAATWTDPWWFLQEIALSFGLGESAGLVILAIATSLLLLGLALAAKNSPEVVALFVLPAVLSTAAYLALGRNLWPRLYFFLAGFLLLAGILGVFGALKLLPRRLGGASPRLERGVELMLILAGALTVSRGWALKQDFEGARLWLDRVREPSEKVVTVGLAILPYRDYRPAPYTPVESMEAFDAAVPPGSQGYVVSTLPIFMESRHPELWRRILEIAVERRRFPGAISGGDVVIYRVAR